MRSFTGGALCVTLALAATLLASPEPARANDGEFYGAGATVYPITSRAISMDKETLVIEQRGPLRTYVDHWLVTVRYEFVNTTDQAVTVQMGFPEHCQRTVEDMDVESPSCTTPAIKDFEARIDDEPVKVTVKTPKKGEEGALPGTVFDRVHTFPVRFGPKARVVVEHSYQHGGRIISPMHSGIDYILRTGGLWKGPIHDFDMRIVLKGKWGSIIDENEEGKRLPKPSFEGWRGGTYQMTWKLTDFTPQVDVAYLLQEPLVVDAREQLNTVMNELSEKPTALDGKSLEELRLLRNLPYALNGYTFEDAELRAHFEKQPWYVARTDYDAKWLNASEKGFVAKVRAVEQRKKAAGK